MKTAIFSWVALLCLLISITNCNAQDSTNIITTQKYNYTQLFDLNQDKAIDITKVPFGVLYNRVYGWSAIANQKEVATVTKNKLVQAWYDLYTATYTFGNSLTFPAFKQYLVQYELNKKIPIIAMQYNFAVLDSSGLLPIDIDSNGNYRDTNGVIMAQKPNVFAKRQAHLVGLFTKEVMQNESITLVLDNKLLLQNTSNSFKKISIYDGTVLIATLMPSNSINYTFKKAGEALLKIECELNNGDIITSLQTIVVLPNKKIRGACGNNQHLPISSTIPFQGYDETVATTSNADYHVFYKYLNNDPTDCDNQITKPLIFVDGFDDLNNRNFEKIYDEYLTTDKVNLKGNIAEKLRLAGYDLIILNFPRLGETIDLGGGNSMYISDAVNTGANSTLVLNNRDGGTDYIERNAMVFIELVKKINAEVANNAANNGTDPEQLVVIGPSMGGQVARYGLAYMEKKFNATNVPSWQHNCRLYVSFDSPHEGANIAITVQQTLDHLGNFFGNVFATTAYATKIRSVAARQLLIEQMDGLNGSANFHQKYYYGTTNNGFDALNTNGLPNSHGYPMNCRKIALVNGSGGGIETLFAGAEVGYVHATAPASTVGFNLHMRFMEPTLGFNKTVEAYNLERLAYLPGWNLNLYSSISTSGNVTGNMNLDRFFSETNWNYIAITWPIWWPVINVVHDKYYKRRSTFTTTNTNSHGCLDAAPGGLIDAVDQIMVEVKATLDDFVLSGAISTIDNLSHDKYSCFIPTISGLGFKNSNFKWNKKISDRNLICNNGNETYFDNYYAPFMNQGHVQITNDSYAWLEKELKYAKQGTDCISLCGVEKILGNDFLCLNTTMTYSLSSFIGLGTTTGIVTSWTHSPGLQISPDPLNPNNKVIVTTLPTATQNEWIKAVVQNPCGSEKVEITKIIHSGAINYTLTFEKVCPICCDYVAIVKCSNPFATATYEWSDNGVFSGGSMSNIYGDYTPGPNSPSCSAKVYVRIKDNCFNFTTLNNQFLICKDPEPGCLPKKETEFTNKPFIGQEVSAFPNPTNDVWHIEIPNYLNKQIKMNLYDMTGKEILRKEFLNLDNGIIDLDSKSLMPNIYLLKVLIDDKVFYLKLHKQ
jgi:Secretion system C-terminal sorting domain